MEEEPKGYRKLRAWQKSDELASAVYKAFGSSKALPAWLSDQVCKAAVSVPANIAEGYSRGSVGDYLRFLDIARGSLGETEYFVEFLRKNGLVTSSVLEALSPLLEETGSLLFALIKSLAQKQKAGTWNRHYMVREEQRLYTMGVEEHGTRNEQRGFLIEVHMSGRPPLHGPSVGISLENLQHPSYERAQSLKKEAAKVMGEKGPLSCPMVIEIENSGRDVQGDASNVIQAIFTALEGVVYSKDAQIKEVHYWEVGDSWDGYLVRVYHRASA